MDKLKNILLQKMNLMFRNVLNELPFLTVKYIHCHGCRGALKFATSTLDFKTEWGSSPTYVKTENYKRNVIFYFLHHSWMKILHLKVFLQYSKQTQFNFLFIGYFSKKFLFFQPWIPSNSRPTCFSSPTFTTSMDVVDVASPTSMLTNFPVSSYLRWWSNSWFT